ncbi:MAG: IclR family transcriptional regulator [Mesorhizobium sp.]|nr:IclR family transcriptional regulator [Mesorhizobium sp.]MBN9243040.1 IclR family transcriptional regulator [Mesorhizobium sp.]
MTEESEGRDERDFVASLEKGLAVIEAFEAGRPRLTLTDVAKLTGTTRAAARRYLRTLTRLGYADFDGRFFSLTPRILRLGYAYLSSAPLPSRILPFLEKISQETGESSSAAMLDGDEIVYIARSATRRILSIGLGVGSRLPAYCTSLGRVILAHRPAAEIDAYLDRVPLERRTPFTVTDRQDLLVVLQGVREQGYATVNEELELGLRSIAVPVRREDGSVQLAINVGTQAARVEATEMTERFLPPLRAAAEALRYMV